MPTLTTSPQGVQQTTDYGRFKLILNNREQVRGHIENLKKAFDESGNLTKIQPILVNENMEIIDGQHRYTAAKELGLPIYYTVAPGLGIHEARQMNILHKTWRTEDYAHSYAEGGDANYRRYLQLREEFGFNHSITLLYIIGDQKKGAMSGFRNGELAISPEDVAAARERLAHLEAVAEHLPGMGHQIEFAVALLKSMNVDGYDPEQMLRKLQFAPEPPKFASVLDYQRALEEIYNWKVTDTNRLRLF